MTRFPINADLPSLRVIEDRDPAFFLIYGDTMCGNKTFDEMAATWHLIRVKDSKIKHWSWISALRKLIVINGDDRRHVAMIYADVLAGLQYIRAGDVTAPMFNFEAIGQ